MTLDGLIRQTMPGTQTPDFILEEFSQGLYQFQSHLFRQTAYNFAHRLKALKGLTPYDYICRMWTSEPE